MLWKSVGIVQIGSFSRNREKAPAEAGAPRSTSSRLELENGRQLDSAWAAAADERVADAYVAGGGDGHESVRHFPGSVPIQLEGSRVSGIRDERRKQRVGEVGMIQ